MKFRSQLTIGLTAVALPLCAVLSSSAIAGSLAETVQFAIGSHPDVREAAANRRATQAELREARGL